MADTSVGRVTVELGLDTRQLKAGAAQATRSVEELGRDLSQAGKRGSDDFGKIESALRDLSHQLTTLTNAVQSGFAGNTRAVEQMSKSLSTVDDRLRKVDNEARKTSTSLQDMGQKMTAVGTKMSLGLTAPMVATGVAAIKVANDFETSMASITGLVGIAADEVDGMTGQVREMAVEFGQSATEAADALYFVTSAGITGADAMSVLEQSLKASAVGMGETMIIADAVSSALNAYGIENLSAAEATDLMVASVREGKMEADALASALPRVLPMASAMSVSFEEVGAAFAAMSRNGTDANEAATQIRGILASLLNPSKQAEEQLNALGLSGAGLRQTIREDGLLVGLEQLVTAFGDNEEAAGVVFGNIRALTGVMSLFGSATESTRTIFDKLSDNTGDLDKAFTAMSDTGAFRVNQAMASMKDAMISLGQTLIPIVLPVFQALTGVMKRVADTIASLPGPIKTVVVVLAGLAAAAGPVLIAVGALIKAWMALKAAMASQAVAGAVAQLTAAGPIIAGIAIAVTAVAIAWTVFSNNAREARERQEALTSAMKAAGDEASTLTDRVSVLVDEYKSLVPGSGGANPLEQAIGAEAFTVAQLTAEGLNQTLSDLDISISQVAATVSTGTDYFENLANELDLAEGNGTGAAAALLAVADTGNAMFDSLLHQAQAGKITEYQFIEILNVLDGLSDAFDDHREVLESDAKAMLTNSETAQELATILGADYYNSLVATGLAEAEAIGRTDVYAYTLEKVRVAVDAVLDPLRNVTEEQIAVARAAVNAADGLTQFQGAMDAARLSAEDGKVTVASLAQELGIVAEVTANQVQLALLDAQDASDDLYNSFDGMASGSRDVERAVREQLMAMLTLTAQVTSLGGSARDVAPTLIKMYNDLIAGAQAAGISRDRIIELIEQIGLLDGMSPEIKLALTMDVAEVKANIEAVMRMFGGVEPGGELEQRLKTRLAFLLDVLRLLEQTPKSRGGGGGGGSRSTKPETPAMDFSWVEGWVDNIANFANDLISRDFADKLVEGSADDIAKAFRQLLQTAFDLKIDKLPEFANVIEQVRAKFSQLMSLSTRRDELSTQIETATDKLADLRDTLADVRKEAEDFSVASGLKSPTLTVLEQARKAQEEYDSLYAKTQQLKSSRQSFIDSIEGAVSAPLAGGRSALGQTRKLLSQARSFRDNIVALRDKGFGPDVIRQVAEAGIIDGNRLARGLLSLTGSEIEQLSTMRNEIASIGAEAGAVAADVLFGADITDAEKKLDAQRSLVAQLFDSAVGEAQKNLEAQQTIVDGLNSELASVESSIRDLTHAIQTDLYNAFASFLSGFSGGIDRLTGQPTRVPNVGTRPSLGGEDGLVSIMPIGSPPPVAPAPALDGVNWDDFGKLLLGEIGKLKPGQKTNWNDGPLPNGGAIVDGYYLPPGLNFGGFMADGGIAMSSTLVGVGEAGPEAIIPLSRLSDVAGGDTIINITVEGSVLSERDLIEQVRQGLLKAQKGGRSILL